MQIYVGYFRCSSWTVLEILCSTDRLSLRSLYGKEVILPFLVTCGECCFFFSSS